MLANIGIAIKSGTYTKFTTCTNRRIEDFRQSDWLIRRTPASRLQSALQPSGYGLLWPA